MIDHAGLIEPVNLALPYLPASLDGLRIAHLTDLHVTRRSRRFGRIGALLANVRVDLVVLTGDYINHECDEDAGVVAMTQLFASLRPRLGIFGVFGNHDTPEFRRRLSGLPIQWLNNRSYEFDSLPLQIVGFEAGGSSTPDSIASLLDLDSYDRAPGAGCLRRGLRLLLSHYPNYLSVAADLGVEIMFSGHTHGGQCRLPGRRPLVNHAGLPLRLTSGILRHRDTIAVVSRGLGEVWLPLRVFCPRQLPICTLRRGSLPGQTTDQIQSVQRW